MTSLNNMNDDHVNSKREEILSNSLMQKLKYRSICHEKEKDESIKIRFFYPINSSDTKCQTLKSLDVFF